MSIPKTDPRVFHITRHDKGWQLKEAKAERPVRVRATQKEAISAAKAHMLQISRTSPYCLCLKVHGIDGKVKQVRLYPGLKSSKNGLSPFFKHYAEVVENGTGFWRIRDRAKRFDQFLYSSLGSAVRAAKRLVRNAVEESGYGGAVRYPRKDLRSGIFYTHTKYFYKRTRV